MAEVFEAFDCKFDKRVALKRPPKEAWIDQGARQELVEEARLQERLRHNHIVRVHDIVDEGLGRAVWMAMDFAEGQSLKDLLLAKGRLGAKRAASTAIQMASALKAAHDANIVHRDVKPSNVMVDDHGWVMLVDFGIARVMHQTMVTLKHQETSGTPLYMAPEQHVGGPGVRDKPVDVYAFGAVLYEMLTGRAAFKDAANPLEADMLEWLAGKWNINVSYGDEA